MKRIYVLAMACLLCALSSFGQVSLIKETQITDEALHYWYPDGQKAYIYAATISPRGDCFTVANGYIFYGWYKGGMNQRNLMLSRKKIGENSWKTIQFSNKNTLIVDPRDKNGPRIFGNTHQTITVAVSDDDGKIHILFDHHNDPLNYIVSKSNIAFARNADFKVSNFESRRSTLTDSERLTITYPEINKNNLGELILNYRRGNSHGGSEFMHVYANGRWSKSKRVVQGYQSPIPANQNNYAYGSPTYGNGRFYYAFSVRWDNNNALNEGVYVADAGNRMTGNWKRIVGNTSQELGLPIRNYSPFLLDDPDTKDNGGSNTSPAFAVTENGDMQVAYRGRGGDSKYFYTYTKKRDENEFTRHSGVYIDADAYGDKFYSVTVRGRVTDGTPDGTITIRSNAPGSVTQTKELEIKASYNFGEFVKFIQDGKLYIITDVRAESDKHETRCYEFDLGTSSTTASTGNNNSSGNVADLENGWYRIKNLETGRYLRSVNSENIIGASVQSGNDKQWRFVKTGNYYNIDSRTTSTGSGVLRARGSDIIGTQRAAPNADTDKVWRVNEVASPQGTYRLELRDTGRFIYNETNDSNKVIKLNTKRGDRSKWIIEPVASSQSSSKATIATRKDELGVRIYPNPASSGFTIALQGFDNANVVISNLLGKVVYSKTMTNNRLAIARDRKFSTGMYLVKVIGQDQTVYNTKLIIK